MLDIRDLYVSVEEKAILKGFNLRIPLGEIHAIMGPNGAGKSTLAKAIAGDPSLEIAKGEIEWDGRSLLEMEVEERAHAGLFVGFQYPVEIPGISNFQFLHAACNAKKKAHALAPLSEAEFTALLDEKMRLLDIREEFKHRDVNGGFSGGEKKRNEILQLAILDPRLAVLDETDSGLDIDALRSVAASLLKLMHSQRALLIITHYQRLLDHIRPDVVHVMVDGKIVQSGGIELARRLEEKGYDGF